MSDILAEIDIVSDHRGHARIGYAAILLVFGGFGVWAANAPLDSAAIAPARIAVEGDRKPVQHLEGGIVREILVREAQQVAEGDVLFRLDPTASRADVDLLGSQIDAASALEARLLAERHGEGTIVFPPELTARAGRPEVVTAMAEQQRLMSERRRSLANQIGILETRIEQTGQDVEGRERRRVSLAYQLESFDSELAAVSELASRGLFPRNRLRALERERSRVEGELAALDGEVSRFRQVIEEARLQIRATRESAEEEVTIALTEVRGQLADLRERRAVAQDVLTRVDIRAPRSGVVLDVKVSSPGSVVAPGATLAEVVPPMENLNLTARVSLLDVQNVAVGQTAEVRFPAFSSSMDPVFGHVAAVSADAVTDERTGETFYQTRVALDAGQLPPDVAARIVPGMPADVLIITGERTLLDYLIGPMRDRLAKAMRDR